MKIYLVGGAVRDKLLGLPVTEQDYVVVGATIRDMLALGYKQVGKEFPVFLHPRTGCEYALARMERKIKPGYTGFQFDTSPDVTLEEDLRRRDLTINAMAYDLETGQIIDPFGGQEDLQHRVLKHVSQAFIEDPVRILRVARFLARYADLGFHVHPDTIFLMQQMVARGEVNALVAERVWKELERGLAEKTPAKFFDVLDESNALKILFPHLTETGRKALASAANLSSKANVRLAALLFDYGSVQQFTERKKLINQLADRYRIPNHFRQLALIVAESYQAAWQAASFTAEELLKLLNKLDVYRRTERFYDFLTATQAIADSLRFNFDSQFLLQAASKVKSIDVKLFVQKGLVGDAIANELYQTRLQRLEQWLNSQKK